MRDSDVNKLRNQSLHHIRGCDEVLLEYNPHLKPHPNPNKTTIPGIHHRNNNRKRETLECIVQQKIDAGEIHIGIPKTSAGERVQLNVEEGRYFIQKGQ